MTGEKLFELVKNELDWIIVPMTLYAFLEGKYAVIVNYVSRQVIIEGDGFNLVADLDSSDNIMSNSWKLTE